MQSAQFKKNISNKKRFENAPTRPGIAAFLEFHLLETSGEQSVLKRSRVLRGIDRNWMSFQEAWLSSLSWSGICYRSPTRTQHPLTHNQTLRLIRTDVNHLWFDWVVIWDACGGLSLQVEWLRLELRQFRRTVGIMIWISWECPAC